MLLKLILPALLISTTMAQARRLIVKHGNSSFRLELTKEAQQLQLRGELLNLSMQKTPCNSHILDAFDQKLEKLLHAGPRSKTPEAGRLKVSVDGQTSFIGPRTIIGRNFLAIPQEVRRMKIEEKLLCKPK